MLTTSRIVMIGFAAALLGCVSELKEVKKSKSTDPSGRGEVETTTTLSQVGLGPLDPAIINALTCREAVIVYANALARHLERTEQVVPPLARCDGSNAVFTDGGAVIQQSNGQFDVHHGNSFGHRGGHSDWRGQGTRAYPKEGEMQEMSWNKPAPTRMERKESRGTRQGEDELAFRARQKGVREPTSEELEKLEMELVCRDHPKSDDCRKSITPALHYEQRAREEFYRRHGVTIP